MMAPFGCQLGTAVHALRPDCACSCVQRDAAGLHLVPVWDTCLAHSAPPIYASLICTSIRALLPRQCQVRKFAAEQYAQNGLHLHPLTTPERLEKLGNGGAPCLALRV